MKFVNLLLFSTLFIFIFSCKKEGKKPKKTQNITSIKYAKGFDIQKFDDYTKLLILSPFPNAKEAHEFFLVDKDQDIPQELTGKKIIRIPLEKIVVTSTTHIPMLELLEEEKSLIGFPNLNYISSEKTNTLIKEGKINELGKEESINTEVLLELNPEAVIGFSLSSNSKMFSNIEKAGIPVLLNGDWLETTPLGRAEWIKFFGTLFNKEQVADSIFDTIKSAYLEAKRAAQKAQTTPTIFSGIEFSQVWNVPAGESFVAQFLKDANTNYIWSDSKGKGSLSLNFESVFEKAQNADIWIDPGLFTSYDQMEKANAHYQQFKAFKDRKVYTYSMKKGENGGVIYYELAPIQPHIVLKDLIKVTHPELLPNYQPYFLEKLQD